MTAQFGLDNLTAFTDRSTRYHPLVIFKLKGLHVSAMKRKKRNTGAFAVFQRKSFVKKSSNNYKIFS